MLDAIKKTLWATADKLRANMSSCEYKHVVHSSSEVKAIAPALT